MALLPVLRQNELEANSVSTSAHCTPTPFVHLPTHRRALLWVQGSGSNFHCVRQALIEHATLLSSSVCSVAPCGRFKLAFLILMLRRPPRLPETSTVTKYETAERMQQGRGGGGRAGGGRGEAGGEHGRVEKVVKSRGAGWGYGK